MKHLAGYLPHSKHFGIMKFFIISRIYMWSMTKVLWLILFMCQNCFLQSNNLKRLSIYSHEIVIDWSVFGTQLLELSPIFSIHSFEYLIWGWIPFFNNNQKDWKFETNFGGSIGIRISNETAFLILHWILKTILDKYQTFSIFMKLFEISIWTPMMTILKRTILVI